jgi:hypothetical protein
MRKFPKFINTKQDVYNLLQLYPEKMKAMLKTAIETHKDWVDVAFYDTEAECIKDETHDWVEHEIDSKKYYVQKEFKPVPKNFLDRIGMSIEEAKGIVD